MDDFWIWLFGSVGVTLIVTTGKVFKPLREWLSGFVKRLNPLRILGDLISCPMCTGFWVGFLWKWLIGGVHVVDGLMWGGLVSLSAYVADLVVGFLELFIGERRG